MNRRKMKKIARRFLDGGNASRYVSRVAEFHDGYSGFRAQVEFRGKLHQAIFSEALQRGWSGCWSSSPFLVYYAPDDGGETCYGFAAACCKAARRLTSG